MDKDLISKAQQGDIRSFHDLFKLFRPELTSFLYRLLADRNDVEDLAQDTFIKAFESLRGFKAQSSLKVWCFSIAYNLSLDLLRRRNRWSVDIKDRAKDYAHQHSELIDQIRRAHSTHELGDFTITEHIDHCFTCISKTLTIEQQVCLILKDIYQFKVKEIETITGKGETAVKHILHKARKTMTDIYADRCALINKQGICHQCSELNNLFNPKQKEQQELMKIRLFRERKTADRRHLFELREELVGSIHPLRSQGWEIQDFFMRLNRKVAGEISDVRTTQKEKL